MIDARAIVDPSAQIGAGVSIGPWTIVGPGVEIGDECQIASHVVIKGPTVMGERNRVFQFSSIGEDTPAFAFQGEETHLIIGDDNTFREGVTVHRGTAQDGSLTRIGSHGLFMAYVHIGHDCVVGDRVIMANNASVAGHVSVGDHANFGGYSGVPQFRSIGAQTHIAAMSLVQKDVPAFMTVSGQPAYAIGLNTEGMKRRGFSAKTMKAVKDAHRIVYRDGHTAKHALELLKDLAAAHPEVALFAQSVESSKWGIVRPKGRDG